jgi:hypothetical protein
MDTVIEGAVEGEEKAVSVDDEAEDAAKTELEIESEGDSTLDTLTDDTEELAAAIANEEEAEEELARSNQAALRKQMIETRFIRWLASRGFRKKEELKKNLVQLGKDLRQTGLTTLSTGDLLVAFLRFLFRHERSLLEGDIQGVLVLMSEIKAKDTTGNVLGTLSPAMERKVAAYLRKQANREINAINRLKDIEEKKDRLRILANRMAALAGLKGLTAGMKLEFDTMNAFLDAARKKFSGSEKKLNESKRKNRSANAAKRRLPAHWWLIPKTGMSSRKSWAIS